MAQAGDAQAQVNLGDMHEYPGRDVEPDLRKALYWYRKAANQGYVRAQMLLGSRRLGGGNIGWKRNDPEAYAWYYIATLNGDKTAKLWLASFQVNSVEPQEMDPGDIAAGQELAKEMIKKNPKLLK